MVDELVGDVRVDDESAVWAARVDGDPSVSVARVEDDPSVSAARDESALVVEEIVRDVWVDDDPAVSEARVEPALSVAMSLVLAEVGLAAVVLGSVVTAAFVIVEASPALVAEVPEASKVVLALAAKVGYGPVSKFPFWPSGSV